MTSEPQIRHAFRARWLAAAALALGAVAPVLIATVDHFPRGLFVLVLVSLAVVAGWDGILRTGPARIFGIGIATIALVASLLLLVTDDLVLVVIAVICAAGAVASARAAVGVRVRLPAAASPSHPALIYNPRSGGGKATRFKLAEEARRRGIEPIELTFEIPLTELVEGLVARGVDGLAVAGGDGTQAQVAAIAAREGIPYACIPAGTRNHFALDLGVDRDDVVGALDAFVDGGERIVDLAEVSGRIFVNNVSLGVYGEAVQAAGYRDAKLRTLLDTIPRESQDATSGPLRWHGPDGVSHDGGLALLISNNVYRLGRLIGTGTRPRMDAGLLGVAVIEPPVPAHHRLLREWALDNIAIEADEPVAAGIDGEAAMLEPPVRFRTRPGALRVRIAPSHPGCSPSAGMPDGAWQGVGEIARIAIGTG